MTHSKLVSGDYSAMVDQVNQHASNLPDGERVYPDLLALEDALLFQVNAKVPFADTLEICAAEIAGAVKEAGNSSREALGVKHFIEGGLSDMQESMAGLSDTAQWVYKHLKERRDLFELFVPDTLPKIIGDEHALAVIWYDLVINWVTTSGQHESDISETVNRLTRLLTLSNATN